MRRVVKKKKRDRKAGLPEEWTAYLAGVYIVLEKKKSRYVYSKKKKNDSGFNGAMGYFVPRIRKCVGG